MGDAWNQDWNQASFHLVPPWAWVIVFLWLAKLILPLISIVQAVPYDWDGAGFRVVRKVDYELASDRSREYKTEYNTLWHRESKQNHGAASMALAHGNGMHLVCFADEIYALTKARMAFAKHDRLSRDDPDRVETLKDAEDHMKSQINRCCHASLTGLFAGALQLNLQVTSLSLFCHISFANHKKPQELRSYLLLVLYLTVAAITSCLDLYRCWFYLGNIYMMLADYEQRARDSTNLDRRHRRWFYFIASVVLLYTVAVAYAVVKGMLGQFYCHGDGSYTWNLNGCVVFRHD